MPNMIRSERSRLGLSQVELAEKLNVSESTIREWETGKRQLSVGKLLEMSELFGCTTDYILGRSEERTVFIISRS